MTAARRTRPRRTRRLAGLLVVAVVLAAVVVAAELVARAVLPGVVRAVVVDRLHLPADQQLDVDAPGILLPQLIGGRIAELRLSTSRIALGGVTGYADVTATGVPLRGGELDGATGTIGIDAEQFGLLLDRAGLPVETVEFDGTDVSVGGSVGFLGADIPVSLTVMPGADDGQLLLTPIAASLGGARLEVSELADRAGPLGAELAATRRVCIADRLPAGLTLTGLRIDGTRAVAEFAADGRIVTEPELWEDGDC